MRRRCLFNSEPYVKKYCDVVLYNVEQDIKFIESVENITTSKYPYKKYGVVGVVVIPKSHNVYGDGSCGVISPQVMICDSNNITEGTHLSDTKSKMCFGEEISISSLSNFNVGITIDNTKETCTIKKMASYVSVPSDYASGTICKHDKNVNYSSSSNYAPSPYLSDGSRNHVYYQTSSPSTIYNYLSDFDGRGNTDKILAVRGSKDYSSWIPTRDNKTDYPAASCCDMFKPSKTGTIQGDWYLPSAGELGYVRRNLKAINNTFSFLQEMYYDFSYGNHFISSYDYWSSTQCSTSQAVICTSQFSSFSFHNKSYATPIVVPFTKIK